jgi:hypothetical protein
MMRSRALAGALTLAALALALAACGKADAPPTKGEAKPATAPPPSPMSPTAPPSAQEAHKIATLQMAVPDGWTAKYDAEWDKWLFETPPIADGRTASARIERAPARAVASPEAYLAHRIRYWDHGAKATIVKRERVKDGFAMTVELRPAADPDHPKLETYVIRQLGNVWYQCMSEWIPDDAIRDQLVGLCKSLKL